MSKYEYLIDKVKGADFSFKPFKHIIIKNFLSEEHFKEIVNTPQIRKHNLPNTKALIQELLEDGYDIQTFPGCITSVEKYLEFIENPSRGINKALVKDYGKDIIESYGMSLYLKEHRSISTASLMEFVNGNQFKPCLEEKFALERETYLDTGIQKYLSGYEISPHPDTRRKALTYMLNINTSQLSEGIEIHTRLMTLKDKYKYLYELWKYNSEIDRCWVPWDWCDSYNHVNTNNTLIIFEPSYDTMHAVKLEYDHLKFQRTQLYGNLWYHEKLAEKSSLHDIDLISRHKFSNSKTIKDRVLSKLINALYGLR